MAILLFMVQYRTISQKTRQSCPALSQNVIPFLPAKNPRLLLNHKVAEGRGYESADPFTCRTHGPVCPGWLKWQLASDWVKRAEAGSPGVRELLRLTPCDLFKYLKDKTLWLVGDSLTLVRPSPASEGP